MTAASEEVYAQESTFLKDFLLQEVSKDNYKEMCDDLDGWDSGGGGVVGLRERGYMYT